MKRHPIIFSAPMVQAIIEGRKTQTRRVIKPQPAGFVPVRCSYGYPGDRLWVREAYGTCDSWVPHIFYRADGGAPNPGFRWKSPIHMPRWASRITLEIIDVRVERLRDISEENARAEGCHFPNSESPFGYDNFRMHWDRLHGPGVWQENPLVWVLEFKKVNEVAI